MATLAEIRAQYPQYDDMSDAQLADAFYRKFYADMNRNEFNAKIGYAPDKTADVVKSGAAGAGRGTASLLGLPGTIADAMREGGEWALRKGYEVATGDVPSPSGGAVERFFAGPQPEIEEQLIGGGRNPLSGERLQRGLSAVTGGASDYQPQTTEGEFSRTVGEFAPAAVTGPGGLVRKGAMAVIPAVSSEWAGQQTKGTALEPWARAGAALGTGMLTAGVKNPVKVAAKGAPTRDVMKSKTDALYQGLRDAGIKYDANAWGATVQRTTDKLLRDGMRRSTVKPAFDLVDEMAQGIGQSLDFDDVNGLVKHVGALARDASAKGDKELAKAFYTIRDGLDDFERNAPFVTTNSTIPAGALNQARSVARRAAHQNIKQRALDEVMKDAETYRSGLESGIRNGILKLLRSKRGKNLFSEGERTALMKVAMGRKPLEQLSRFGYDLTSISGNASFLPTMAAGGAYLAGAPGFGMGLAAAGTGAKMLSPRLTQRALDQASAAIRSGKLTGSIGTQVSNQLIDQNIRRFLATQNALTASRTPSR